MTADNGNPDSVWQVVFYILLFIQAVEAARLSRSMRGIATCKNEKLGHKMSWGVQNQCVSISRFA
jgi:hypothetical protein